MTSIQNKVIVITGSSEGIGAALAIRLAAGNKLVLAARRMDKLQEVAKQVQAAGGQVHCVACDVTEQAQCENLVEESVKVFGGIDMVVNNAGVSMHAWFEDITDRRQVELDLSSRSDNARQVDIRKRQAKAKKPVKKADPKLGANATNPGDGTTETARESVVEGGAGAEGVAAPMETTPALDSNVVQELEDFIAAQEMDGEVVVEDGVDGAENSHDDVKN